MSMGRQKPRRPAYHPAIRRESIADLLEHTQYESSLGIRSSKSIMPTGIINSDMKDRLGRASTVETMPPITRPFCRSGQAEIVRPCLRLSGKLDGARQRLILGSRKKPTRVRRIAGWRVVETDAQVKETARAQD
jgi:hypothetical protein